MMKLMVLGNNVPPHQISPLDLGGFVFARAENGDLVTNTPWVVVEHSPVGFNVGYGGSGPADLALNVLEETLRILHHEGPRMNLFKGSCFSLSWAHHQEFKWKYIATIEELPAIIALTDVITWINGKIGSSTLDN